MLSNFRMESQANIIADYYILKNNGVTEWKAWNFLEKNSYATNAIGGGLQGLILIYEVVLKLFLQDPSNKNVLFNKMNPSLNDIPFR